VLLDYEQLPRFSVIPLDGVGFMATSMTNDESEFSSLIQLIIDLANTIDSVVDLGITIAMTDTKVAGREVYCQREAEHIRSLGARLDSILTNLNSYDPYMFAEMTIIGSDVVFASHLLSSEFITISNHRTHQPETILAAIESVSIAWETIHTALLRLIEMLGLAQRDWFSVIRQRHGTYQTSLTELHRSFRRDIHPDDR
jgi:hypothetical protein